MDLVLKLTLGPLWASKLTLDWLRGRLALDSDFKKRLVNHPRCVRVSYAGDFHLDIVPGRRVPGTIGSLTPVRLQVPNAKGGWRFSNPEGFVRWCNNQDKRTGGDFQRVVMMLKRWRDNSAPEKRRVRSIVFTSLIGRSVLTWSGPGSSIRPDADVLTVTLGRLYNKLKLVSAVPVVSNPSLASENLARDWKRADFVAFRKELAEAYKYAVYARGQTDPKAWRLLFGPAFPVDA